MEYGSLFGTYETLGSDLLHGRTIYISHTISSLYMEMDLIHPLPHNFEVQGIDPYDAPQHDMWYTKHARE
jgi:hypothetical protein